MNESNTEPIWPHTSRPDCPVHNWVFERVLGKNFVRYRCTLCQRYYDVDSTD